MKILAAKIIMFFCLITIPVSSHSTGIPVFDAGNLSQNVLTAIENIFQTIKQIEQYRTQIEQYERQMEDALDFDEFIWDQADATISDMLGEMSDINDMKDLVLEVDGYLESMEDGITTTEVEAIYRRAEQVLNKENQSIDEMIITIEDQQDSIQEDADKLIELQEKAEEGGDVGQMQALQTANMLSSHMGNQLLQMRSVLQAQNRAEAAFRLRANAKESSDAAAMKTARDGEFIPSAAVAY